MVKKLYVVGFGPGNREGLTAAAEAAIYKSCAVVGYTVYAGIIEGFFPGKEFITTAMRHERERVLLALEKADEGKTVSLVCSGDSGIYGLASLAIELGQGFPEVEIEIVAGVTAALSGGAVLGAPLGHDFAVISLSDLLTPWELIEKRLECAAVGDFAIALYNPSSKRRAGHLAKACDILLRHKPDETVCGLVKNIGREGEECRVLILSELKNAETDMFTTVFVGNGSTRVINGKMVTPRGYKNV